MQGLAAEKEGVLRDSGRRGGEYERAELGSIFGVVVLYVGVRVPRREIRYIG